MERPEEASGVAIEQPIVADLDRPERGASSEIAEDAAPLRAGESGPSGYAVDEAMPNEAALRAPATVESAPRDATTANDVATYDAVLSASAQSIAPAGDVSQGDVARTDGPRDRGARRRRRIKMGVVRSDKMDKTIVVVTETRVPHPVYKKIVRKSVRFKAHDERNDAKIGDTVRIMETRPISRDKRWRLLEIVERAK